MLHVYVNMFIQTLTGTWSVLVCEVKHLWPVYREPPPHGLDWRCWVRSQGQAAANPHFSSHTPASCRRANNPWKKKILHQPEDSLCSYFIIFSFFFSSFSKMPRILPNMPKAIPFAQYPDLYIHSTLKALQ